MTDKQIIIDGVDVSGCTRYCADNGKCTAFKSQYLCSERNNCYTKRILKKNKTINILKEKLLHKEQECEAYKMEADEGKEINAELNAENEELKKCYKNNSALLDFEETNTTKLVNKVMKLEKTLTEIKEIAEKLKNFYEELGKCEDLTVVRLKQILQKISEVEDET